MSDITLEKNDYNSSIFVFDIDIDYVTGKFSVKYPNDNVYIEKFSKEDSKIILERGFLNQSGTYQFEIALYGNNGRITNPMVGSFNVKEELIDTDSVVSEDSRLPILDRLIYETDNLDIDVEKVDKIATITLTKKDGSTKSVEIYDGEGGGGGEGGTSNYNLLSNKPKINNVELTGNKSLNDLGITPYDDTSIRNQINTINQDLGGIQDEIQSINNNIDGLEDNKADKKSIPTKTSQLNNDSNFLTQIPSEYKTKQQNDQLYQEKGNYVSDSNYVHTDNNYTTTEKNKLAGLENYYLPIASSSRLGGIKVGANLTIDSDGTLNATGGGGEGGTSDYNALSNKPQINGTTLNGNKTSADLGIVDVNDALTEQEVTDMIEQYGGEPIDLSEYAKKEDLPSKLSQLTNDEGFIKGGYSVDNRTESIYEIQPNKFYIWGEVASLNITLATPSDNTIANEYLFQFTSGSTATELTLPNTIKWVQTPTIEANKTYQVSILNNIGVIAGA